jgi:hypothetical protein
MRYLFAVAAMSLVPGLSAWAQEAAPTSLPAASTAAQVPAKKTPPSAQAGNSGAARKASPAAAPDEARAKKPAPAPGGSGEASSSSEESAAEATARSKPDEQLPQTARAFYEALINRDVDGLSGLCRPPFYFEGKAVQTGEEIKRRWSGFLQGKGLSTARLFRVDLLTIYGDRPLCQDI